MNEHFSSNNVFCFVDIKMTLEIIILALVMIEIANGRDFFSAHYWVFSLFMPKEKKTRQKKTIVSVQQTGS